MRPTGPVSWKARDATARWVPQMPPGTLLSSSKARRTSALASSACSLTASSCDVDAGGTGEKAYWPVGTGAKC